MITHYSKMGGCLPIGASLAKTRDTSILNKKKCSGEQFLYVQDKPNE